jgi:hypothetical protein
LRKSLSLLSDDDFWATRAQALKAERASREREVKSREASDVKPTTDDEDAMKSIEGEAKDSTTAVQLGDVPLDVPLGMDLDEIRAAGAAKASEEAAKAEKPVLSLHDVPLDMPLDVNLEQLRRAGAAEAARVALDAQQRAEVQRASCVVPTDSPQHLSQSASCESVSRRQSLPLDRMLKRRGTGWSSSSSFASRSSSSGEGKRRFGWVGRSMARHRKKEGAMPPVEAEPVESSTPAQEERPKTVQRPATVAPLSRGVRGASFAELLAFGSAFDTWSRAAAALADGSWVPRFSVRDPVVRRIEVPAVELIEATAASMLHRRKSRTSFEVDVSDASKAKTLSFAACQRRIRCSGLWRRPKLWRCISWLTAIALVTAADVGQLMLSPRVFISSQQAALGPGVGAEANSTRPLTARELALVWLQTVALGLAWTWVVQEPILIGANALRCMRCLSLSKVARRFCKEIYTGRVAEGD